MSIDPPDKEGCIAEASSPAKQSSSKPSDDPGKGGPGSEIGRAPKMAAEPDEDSGSADAGGTKTLSVVDEPDSASEANAEANDQDSRAEPEPDAKANADQQKEESGPPAAGSSPRKARFPSGQPNIEPNVEAPLRLAPSISISESSMLGFLIGEAGFNENAARDLIAELRSAEELPGRVTALSSALYKHYLQPGAAATPLGMTQKRRNATPVQTYSQFDVLGALVLPKYPLPSIFGPQQPLVIQQPTASQEMYYTQQPGVAQAVATPVAQAQPQQVTTAPAPDAPTAPAAPTPTPTVAPEPAAAKATPPAKASKRDRRRAKATLGVEFAYGGRSVTRCDMLWTKRRGVAAEAAALDRGDVSKISLRPMPDAVETSRENPPESEHIFAKFRYQGRNIATCALEWVNAATCKKNFSADRAAAVAASGVEAAESSANTMQPTVPALSLLLAPTSKTVKQVREAQRKAKRDAARAARDKADCVAEWVQCDSCDKWRRVLGLPEKESKWFCSDAGRSCEEPEDTVDADEQLVAGERSPDREATPSPAAARSDMSPASSKAESQDGASVGRRSSRSSKESPRKSPARKRRRTEQSNDPPRGDATLDESDKRDTSAPDDENANDAATQKDSGLVLRIPARRESDSAEPPNVGSARSEAAGSKKASTSLVGSPSTRRRKRKRF